MFQRHRIALFAALLVGLASAALADDGAWPPPLRGANDKGTLTVKSANFLKIPDHVAELSKKDGAAAFVMAKTPPTVYLAYHHTLPNMALNGTGWSAWGDIAVADDGRVYVGTGDHGDDRGGKSFCFIYCWDPKTKVLTQVVDVNKVVKPKPGDPTWSKVHARIVAGSDGMIYFTCTLNDGGRAGEYKWTDNVPGGQFFRYNPETGKTDIVGHFPGMVTPTTLIDRERMVFYANLEPTAQLAAWDIKAGRFVFKDEPGAVKANRNIALARDGSVYFNGEGGLWRYDPESNTVAPQRLEPTSEANMRASTSQAKDGWIYGMANGGSQLFRFNPDKQKLEMLGPNFLLGSYTTVAVLSPDEKYVYYLPGSHGGAVKDGCPVVQYDIAKRERKVIAFLGSVFPDHGYVPGGSYGVKISADGSTIYANLNGHATDEFRHERMRPFGFGLTALAVVEIPESER